MPRIIGAAGDILKFQQHVHNCSNSAPTALLKCPVHALLPACAISSLKSPLCATRGPPFVMPNTIARFDNNQVTSSKGLLRSLCTVKGKVLLTPMCAALQAPTDFAPNVAVRFDYSQVVGGVTEFVSLYYSDRFTTTPSNPNANLKQSFGVSALSDSQSPSLAQSSCLGETTECAPCPGCTQTARSQPPPVLSPI